MCQQRSNKTAVPSILLTDLQIHDTNSQIDLHFTDNIVHLCR